MYHEAQILALRMAGLVAITAFSMFWSGYMYARQNEGVLCQQFYERR